MRYSKTFLISICQQKTVLFTRQQAEEAATTYSNVPSKLDQEEKIASFLQGPTSILILSKFNVYGYLKQIITGIDEEESQESDDEPKVSDGCFLALYGDNFQASTDESTAEKEIRTFFPDGIIDTRTPTNLLQLKYSRLLHQDLTSHFCKMRFTRHLLQVWSSFPKTSQQIR